MNGDTVFQRCGCMNPATGKRWDRACPRLGDPGHGSWYFACSANPRPHPVIWTPARVAARRASGVRPRIAV
jgi:hypothetical protein